MWNSCYVGGLRLAGRCTYCMPLPCRSEWRRRGREEVCAYLYVLARLVWTCIGIPRLEWLAVGLARPAVDVSTRILICTYCDA